jgi:hypothetical protein
MSDSIVFEESVASEVSISEFVDKQFLYVNDNNNGSYSSQVVLDTTPLSNSGSYLNWSEAFILIPLQLQLDFVQSLGNVATTTALDYVAALKSGYWNIIHSMTVEMNNSNVISQTPFTNVFCNFKNITSWSEEDLKNWSDVTGFCPDSSRAWAYLTDIPDAVLALSASGSGLSNNRNAPYVSITVLTVTGAAGAITANSQAYNTTTQSTSASSDLRQAWNEGLFCRQSAINYDPILTAGNAFSTNQGILMAAAQCDAVFRSYAVANVINRRTFLIDAVIRLKDVADFFGKTPLMKGATMRIFLNTNQCYFQVTQTSATYAAATGVLNAQPILALTASPVILGGGGTNPIMFASAGLGQGASALTPLKSDAGGASNCVTNVSLSIVRQQFSQMSTGAPACPISSVRLYCPAYVMSPLAEQRYLALSPSKKIIYEDIFQFSFPSQNTNSPFNILVSQGIPNLKSVLVLALLPVDSNGAVIAAGAPAPFANGSVRTASILSPFSSTPSSPDPLSIQNFQIQISGKNLFISQLQYDYENFVEQLSASNQLNGGLTTAMASGLVGKSDFQSLYRYYYGNASRSLPSEYGVAKSVQILGTIASSLAQKVDLMVFCSYERTITVDVRTGLRLA